jgi:hypothetical protein
MSKAMASFLHGERIASSAVMSQRLFRQVHAVDQELGKQVRQRTNHTCVICGFKALTSEAMLVHPKNGDHADVREDNLVPVCTICHSALHLPNSIAESAVALVYCPELTQLQIIHLARSIMVARRSVQTARDPSMFENVVRSAEHLHEGILSRQCERPGDGVRLYPLHAAGLWSDTGADKIVDGWCEVGGAFSNLRPTTWRGLYRKLFGSLPQRRIGGGITLLHVRNTFLKSPSLIQGACAAVGSLKVHEEREETEDNSSVIMGLLGVLDV